MSIWHGFFPETAKIIFKACDYTIRKINDYYNSVVQEIDSSFQKSIYTKRDEIIENIKNIRKFIEETVGRSRGFAKDYITSVQEQLKSILTFYLLELNKTKEIVGTPDLIREKKIIEDILEGPQYKKLKGDIYLQYYEYKKKKV